MTFRFASLRGRSQLVVGDGTRSVDLEKASGGRLPADPISAFARWGEVRDFAATVTDPGVPFALADLDAPSPRPPQMFGIGLNYRSHAEESKMDIPTSPLTFTKFPSSAAGPAARIPVVGGMTDWEVELVVVIAAGGRDIAESAAWDRVAGVCIGQDISDRALQFATKPPQFNLGKSRRNFSPFGPWIVDAAGLADRDALRIAMTLDGEPMQSACTDDLIFSVPAIVSYLSGIVELLPGDVIFTGTPGGVGVGMKPPRFLAPGNTIVSTLVGHLSMSNVCE
jgi:2-keto-4-pentenoate hydratase/2-oxohepta-3-ene-1,7-dioic acid hydratase in catechol pathway